MRSGCSTPTVVEYENIKGPRARGRGVAIKRNGKHTVSRAFTAEGKGNTGT